MISDTRPTECYAYITLPGQTDAVTAGRVSLSTDAHGTPIGRFVYGRSYLDRPDCVPIDPVELKLSRRTYRTTALNGIFGALRDAGRDVLLVKRFDREKTDRGRMCFNSLISNTDDHPRNHALLAKQGDWELAMTCGDAGRYANAGNLISQSARFLLEQDQANMIVSEMEEHIEQIFGAGPSADEAY